MGGNFRNDGETVAEAFYQANKDEMEARRGHFLGGSRRIGGIDENRARDGHA